MASEDRVQDDPTAGLLVRLTDQTSTLIRQEMALARAEFQEQAAEESASRSGPGLTPLFGLAAVGALVAGVILVLATIVQAWIAALAVSAVCALLAVLSSLAGRPRQEPAGFTPLDEQMERDDENFEISASRTLGYE